MVRWDNLYKIGKLLIGLLIAIALFRIGNNRNGRFESKEQLGVFDTKTGKTYFFNPNDLKYYDSIQNFRDTTGGMDEIPR